MPTPPSLTSLVDFSFSGKLKSKPSPFGHFYLLGEFHGKLHFPQLVEELFLIS